MMVAMGKDGGVVSRRYATAELCRVVFFRMVRMVATSRYASRVVE